MIGFIKDPGPGEYVIRLHGCVSTGEAYLKPLYVESGDPDYQPEPNATMSGQVTPTHDIDRALRFKTWDEAVDWWRQPSKILPTRPDGKPNRPFTAYDVEFVRVLVLSAERAEA